MALALAPFSRCRYTGAILQGGAVSSAVEHYVDIVGVTGSIPVLPTSNFKTLGECAVRPSPADPLQPHKIELFALFCLHRCAKDSVTRRCNCEIIVRSSSVRARSQMLEGLSGFPRQSHG